MSGNQIDPREKMIMTDFFDLLKSDADMNESRLEAVLAEIGEIVAKQTASINIVKIDNLEAILSGVCDLSDLFIQKDWMYLLSSSLPLLKSLISLVARWKSGRDTVIHNCFHMVLYILLGMLSARESFQQFLKSGDSNPWLENEMLSMSTLLADEIQYSTQEMLLEFIMRMCMAYTKWNPHNAEILLNGLPDSVVRSIDQTGPQMVIKDMRKCLMDVNRANRYIFSYEVYETVPEFDNSSHSKSYLDMGLDIFSLSKRQGVASFKYSDVKKVRIVQEEMTFEILLDRDFNQQKPHASEAEDRHVLVSAGSEEDFTNITRQLYERINPRYFSDGGKTSIAVCDSTKPTGSNDTVAKIINTSSVLSSPSSSYSKSSMNSDLSTHSSCLYESVNVTSLSSREALDTHQIDEEASPLILEVKDIAEASTCQPFCVDRSPERTITLLATELSLLQSNRLQKKLLLQKESLCTTTERAYSNYFFQLKDYMNSKEHDVKENLHGLLTQYIKEAFEACAKIELLCNVVDEEALILTELISTSVNDFKALCDEVPFGQQNGFAALLKDFSALQKAQKIDFFREMKLSISQLLIKTSTFRSEFSSMKKK